MRHAFDSSARGSHAPCRTAARGDKWLGRFLFVLILGGIAGLTAAILLPMRAGGCGSPTVATASRLRMLGMMAQCYAEEVGNGLFPASSASFRAYEPNLPLEVVFSLEEAIPHLLKVGEDAEAGRTPCVWLAERLDERDPASQLLALKRVDHAGSRQSIVLLFGDRSLRYLNIDELPAALQHLGNDAGALDATSADPAEPPDGLAGG